MGLGQSVSGSPQYPGGGGSGEVMRTQSSAAKTRSAATFQRTGVCASQLLSNPI